MTAPLILGCAGPHLARDEALAFAEIQPWAFILFARNCESAEQIRGLCEDLRAAVGWQAPIFIDQEGGRVQRLRPPLAREWLPPLEEVARFGSRAARALALRYRIISAELLSLGIDGNCVPALDVARPDTHPVLRNRLLGDDPRRVAELGRVVAEACLTSGVLPVVKHMPGHGRGTLDSHLELPRVCADPDQLDADFAPFRALSDLPLGMTAHLVFEKIDPQPATISPRMIDLIRHDIGFDGLLMTDDISMEALSGSVVDRGQAALAAGCDMVLHCNGNLSEIRALAAGLPPLSAAGQARATRALAARRVADPVDIAALEEEFAGLSKQTSDPDD